MEARRGAVAGGAPVAGAWRRRGSASEVRMKLCGCARREGVQMRPQPAAPTWAGEGAAAGGDVPTEIWPLASGMAAAHEESSPRPS